MEIVEAGKAAPVIDIQETREVPEVIRSVRAAWHTRGRSVIISYEARITAQIAELRRERCLPLRRIKEHHEGNRPREVRLT